MLFIDAAKFIIPGYELLTEEEQGQFQQTAAGERFVAVIDDMLLQLASGSSIWDWLDWLTGEEEKKKEDAQKIMKEELLAELQDNNNYKQTISLIIVKKLNQVYPDFQLLTDAEKTTLANAEFSRPLQAQLIPLEEKIEKQREKELNRWFDDDSVELQELEKKRDAIFPQWLEEFKGNPGLANIWNKISLNHAEQRKNDLINFFPAINAYEGEVDHFDFIQEYCKESRKPEPDFERVEEEFLTACMFSTIQKMGENHINFINLNNFNLKQANKIAKKILEAFNSENELEIESWLEDYRLKLVEHIRLQLLRINGHLHKIPDKRAHIGVLNSLSQLFMQSDTKANIQKFLAKAGAAHAFIQYTGMSTQNEAAWLVALDLYNYYHTADQIIEVKTVLISLLKPFLPLYKEYKHIALYEKNVYLKLFRALMPLLIIAGVMVAVGAMLSPLAIPEFAFLIAAVPTLIIGFFLASQYVVAKNVIHNSLRRVYYGGLFEIPEFQVNERMIHIFGSAENAELIREAYIEEIKLCDDKERRYMKLEKNGLLTQEEIERRKENLKRRYTINLEWYDIHSNADVGYDKIPQIVEFRLEEFFRESLIKLQEDLEQQDLEQIKTYARQIVEEVKAELSNVREEESQEEILLENNAPQLAASSYSSSENGPQFFQPRSIASKRKAAKLDTVLEMIGALESSDFRTFRQ